MCGLCLDGAEVAATMQKKRSEVGLEWKNEAKKIVEDRSAASRTLELLVTCTDRYDHFCMRSVPLS